MSEETEEQVQPEGDDLVQDLGHGPLSGEGDSTPQATRDQPTIANKMKWFFLRQAFKVTVKTAKVTVIVALVVLWGRLGERVCVHQGRFDRTWQHPARQGERGGRRHHEEVQPVMAPTQFCVVGMKRVKL